MYRTALLSLVLVAGVATTAAAQLNTAPQNVSLSARKAEQLSLSLSTASFNLASVANGGVYAFGDLTVGTSWDLRNSAASVTVSAQLTTPLTDAAGNVIAHNHVTVRGGAGAAFTSTEPFASGTAMTVQASALGAGRKQGSASATMTLGLDLTGANVVPGDYAGTVTFVATAQ